MSRSKCDPRPTYTSAVRIGHIRLHSSVSAIVRTIHRCVWNFSCYLCVELRSQEELRDVAPEETDDPGPKPQREHGVSTGVQSVSVSIYKIERLRGDRSVGWRIYKDDGTWAAFLARFRSLSSTSKRSAEPKLPTTHQKNHPPSLAKHLPEAFSSYHTFDTMSHSTSSTSTSSHYTSFTSSLGDSHSYPKELDISGPSSSDRSSSSRPLMSYSTPFTSNWKKDFGVSNAGRQHQDRRAWSTGGNAGSNP
ncbi:hypothetical protein GGR58DRAFT_520262 [Xylaria digitata]|nr:hypothetical protein GGR58DRAFT_520262 [Xylaria digitata]